MGMAPRVRVEVASNASPAIENLRYVKHESTSWLVLFGLEMNGQWIPSVEYDGKPRPRTEVFDGLNPGDLFFKDGPLKHRFKFLGFEERSVENPRLNIVETLKFARFRDMAPAKKGRIHEVPNRLPRARWHDYVQYEEKARFLWDPMDRDPQELIVEEGSWFQVPGDRSSRKFLLKRVMPGSVTVQWYDRGSIRTREIASEDCPIQSSRTIREMLGY